MSIKTYPVALTGGIGSGKSIAANFFKNLFNIEIISADQCAQEVILLPKIIYLINKKFGNNIMNKNGSVNKKILRNIIINNDHSRLWLNNLMHPIIQKKIRYKLSKSKSSYTIIDIPLLTKNNLNYYFYFKKIILIYASYVIKIKRIINRDCQTKIQAMSIIRSQINDDERRKFSDFFIKNDDTIDKLKFSILNINKEILKLISK